MSSESVMDEAPYPEGHVDEPRAQWARLWGRWAPELLIGAAAIVTYLNALLGDFVSDALFLIPRNPALIQSKGWFVWFLRDYFWGSLDDVTLYRPLTILSFLLHVRTTGVAPFPFLLVNVLLHAGVSVLVFRLGTRLVGRLAAFLGAMLFAVHPLHTEVVAWIMGRSDLLAALFALAACLGFLRATDPEEPRPWRFVVATVIAYLAALFSKEHVALLPLWFGLLWWLERPNRAARPALYVGLGSAAAFVAFLLLRAAALTREPTADIPIIGLFNPAAVVPAPQRWLTAAAVIWRYTLLFVWPARLSNDYSYAQTEASTGLGGAEAAGLLMILALLAGIIVAWRRAPGVALALAFVPITFFLVSNIPFPIGTVMAERLTYLPSVGVCLVAGWAVGRLHLPAAVMRRAAIEQEDETGTMPESNRQGWVVAGLLAAILMALFVRAATRNSDWRTDSTLFASAIRLSPKSSNVQAGQALQERNRGNTDRAMELVQQALRTYPNNFNALLLSAELHLARQDFDRAAEYYGKALRMAPRAAPLHTNLGYVFAVADNLAEAEREFREAVRLAPNLVQARLLLGGLLLKTQRPAEALQEFQESARLDPESPVPVYSMANAFLALGDRQAADAYARRAAAAGYRVPEEFWRLLRSPSGPPERPLGRP